MRVNFDVLMILDALDRHGSFATAAESLYKTPAALSYMIQKLESDLDIVCWIVPAIGQNLPIPGG
jgi:DNA-binding transcriptional LysR family regulator